MKNNAISNNNIRNNTHTSINLILPPPYIIIVSMTIHHMIRNHLFRRSCLVTKIICGNKMKCGLSFFITGAVFFFQCVTPSSARNSYCPMLFSCLSLVLFGATNTNYRHNMCGQRVNKIFSLSLLGIDTQFTF